MSADEIRALIAAGLACDEVRVTGDGRHFDALVVSDAFTGKATLARHRMVYATLGDRFDTEVLHALSLKTYTVQQWHALGD
jgi:acid stress-induced BolA-like protein IbaG/YrbA